MNDLRWEWYETLAIAHHNGARVASVLRAGSRWAWEACGDGGMAASALDALRRATEAWIRRGPAQLGMPL